MGRTRQRQTRGAAMLEMALLMPWILFLFVGALDWGFYACSLISVENAARSAVAYTSGAQSTDADQAGACSIVLAELQSLPNIGATVTPCGSSPLVVAASEITRPDNAIASQVTVTYTTPALIPIPGLLAKQFTFVRILKMKV